MPAVLADFADRMTAALENGLAAVNDLNAAIPTGAPVNQASVNTLLKVMQDLGQVATDARKAAVDEAAANAPAAPADSSAKASTPSTPSTAGSGTAKS